MRLNTTPKSAAQLAGHRAWLRKLDEAIRLIAQAVREGDGIEDNEDPLDYVTRQDLDRIARL